MTRLNTTRRQLLKVGLGLSQVALLERFGLRSTPAYAQPTDGPTKLVTLYMQGGYRPQFYWWGQDDAMVDITVPPRSDFAGEPVFFSASDLADLGGTNGNYKPLRLWKSWSDADPSMRNDGVHTPMMYGWKHFDLAGQTCVLHGVDQGSNAHGSAYVASMCGVAGGDYRAPALQSVVANHFYERFRDTRPLPCVTVNSYGMPVATGLPSAAAPILVPTIEALKPALSGKAADNWWWSGLEDRVSRPDYDVRGHATGGMISTTQLENFSIGEVAKRMGHSTPKVDSYLEGIHGSLRGVSKALAADVVSVLGKINGTEWLEANHPDYLKKYFNNPFGYSFGAANFHQTQLEPTLGMALRLLKSDLCTAVHTAIQSPYYDSHSGQGGQMFSCAQGRAEMDCLARFIGELKNTPAPGKPGKTLLDDTLVIIHSEFARSWAYGRTQSDPSSWGYPDDHHPITSLTYCGGNIAGQRQVGSYQSNGIGTDVDIIEENGQASKRMPRASDATATALRVMGLKFDEFFIPGGFGEVVGIRKDG